MSIAKERALTLRDLYGISEIPGDQTLDLALRHLGMRVIEWRPQYSNNREIYRGRYLFLRHDQGREWKRWVKAHAIGHRFLHVGDQSELDAVVVAKQERQAEIFAGWFIFGHLPPAKWAGLVVTPLMLANAAKVPIECVQRWWELVKSGWAN